MDLRGENTQFLQMIEDATAPDPPFRKVLLANRSRDSSQIDDLEPHRARLAAHEVEIISASELSLRALGPAVGAMLREQYSRRVRRGMRAIAQRGFYAFANAPYGYRKVPVWDGDVRRHKLEPDPPASETVRWIFDLRLEGATHLEIVAELIACGDRPPGISPWNARQVRRILRNEVYCGTSLAARKDMENPNTAVRAVNAFPAIVSQEEFDTVQRMEQRPDAEECPECVTNADARHWRSAVWNRLPPCAARRSIPSCDPQVGPPGHRCNACPS